MYTQHVHKFVLCICDMRSLAMTLAFPSSLNASLSCLFPSAVLQQLPLNTNLKLTSSASKDIDSVVNTFATCFFNACSNTCA